MSPRRPLAGLCLSLAFAALPVRAEVIDRIVAIVEGEPILLSELDLAKSPYLSNVMAIDNPEHRAEKEQQLTTAVLEQLIDEHLLKRQIKTLGIVVEDREIEMAIEDILERNKLDRDRLRETLEQQGKSFDEYRDELREQLSRLKLINMKIKGQVEVSEEDVENYLTQNRPAEEEELHARHILFKLAPDAPEEEVAAVTARAQEVLARARAGEDFAELAKAFSQGPTAPKGGDLGFFKRGQMVPDFENAAFALNAGQLSEPVRTSFGLHLIEVVERRAVTSPASPERDRVRQGLYQQAMERKLQLWLEELKKTSNIEYKL